MTRADMQRDFLADTLSADPLDYVRCAIEYTGSDWLPIRHFARAAGLSHPQLLAFVEENQVASPSQKQLYADRLSSPDKAYTAAKGPARDMLSRILAGEDVGPKDVAEARLVAVAAQGLPRPLPMDPAPLRTLLARCATLIGASTDKSAKSAIRKAIARLDEATCP